jgi:hypothetical protein
MKIKVKRRHMKVRAARMAKRPAKRTSTSAQRNSKLKNREQRTKRLQDSRFDTSPRMWVRKNRRDLYDYWLNEQACRLSDQSLKHELKLKAAAADSSMKVAVATLLASRWYDRRHWAAMMTEMAPETKV